MFTYTPAYGSKVTRENYFSVKAGDFQLCVTAAIGNWICKYGERLQADAKKVHP